MASAIAEKRKSGVQTLLALWLRWLGFRHASLAQVHGILSNPVFSTKFLFLHLNRRTNKLLPISLIASSCTFRLVCRYSTPILRAPSAHLGSSGQRAFVAQASLLSKNRPCYLRHSSSMRQLNLPSRPIFSLLNTGYWCVAYLCALQ